MVAYISQSSDLTLYLDSYLLEKCHTGILVSCDLMIDLKIYLGQCDLYFRVQ